MLWRIPANYHGLRWISAVLVVMPAAPCFYVLCKNQNLVREPSPLMAPARREARRANFIAVECDQEAAARGARLRELR
jgi:hypothetical protein